MMNVEIEITNRCNAACPGCRRTLHKTGFELEDIEPELLFERFKGEDLSQKRIRLCGVLGDPMVHPRVIEISKWFLNKEARVHISTNASLREPLLWEELGKISYKTGRLYIQFAVDGLEDTNHLYRVNTDFNKIMKNIDAFVKAGGNGGWVFIEFDHNRHQIGEARKLANEKNLGFFVRRAAKNNVQEWKVKDKKAKKDYGVTSKNGKAHSQAEVYKKIIQDKHSFDHKDVNCKFMHEGEFFIAANGTVWPCCYLWDELQKKDTILSSILCKEEKGFNDLKTHTLENIFSNSFYKTLEDKWHQDNPAFLKRCHSSCGAKGKLRNSFSSS